jgi:hypothetical protein
MNQIKMIDAQCLAREADARLMPFDACAAMKMKMKRCR